MWRLIQKPRCELAQTVHTACGSQHVTPGLGGRAGEKEVSTLQHDLYYYYYERK